MINNLTSPVDLIVVGEALEAIALRSALEAFGVNVRCYFMGHVNALISCLNGDLPLSKIVILSCHGDERGMILPELSLDLEKTMPYHRFLTGADWAVFLKLNDQIIINTGCCLETESFACSFIEKGASAYIGFEGYPEGHAAVYKVMSFLYFYLCHQLPLPVAFEKTVSLGDEDGKFKLYQKDTSGSSGNFPRGLKCRSLSQADIPLMVAAFAHIGWTKPASLYEQYLEEQEKNYRCVWVAFQEGVFAGYVTLKWHSDYPSFREKNIPEISDLNVLPSFRQLGIGSTLLALAETEASSKGTRVGIGVGLSADYGEAQKLYVKRGYSPDGQGLTSHYHSVSYGSSAILDDDLILWLTKTLP